MSNAFETAWQLVKMARHIIDDDIEFWDPLDGYARREMMQEQYPHLVPKLGELGDEDYWTDQYGDEGSVNEEGNWRTHKLPREEWMVHPSAYSFLPDATHGRDRQSINARGMAVESDWNWDEDGNYKSTPKEVMPHRGSPYTMDEINAARQAAYDDRPIYYPISYGAIPGDSMTKIMMTPNQYLGLASNPPREDRSESSLQFQRDVIAANKEAGGRTPYGMPYLNIQMTSNKGVYPSSEQAPLQGPEDYKVTGHEGRHRMQTLVDRGLGDVRVPVLITISDSQKHSWGKHHDSGRNANWEKNLDRSWIQPQNSYYYGEGWDSVRHLPPKERPEEIRGLHPEGRGFRIRDKHINTNWDRGEYFDERPLRR